MTFEQGKTEYNYAYSDWARPQFFIQLVPFTLTWSILNQKYALYVVKIYIFRTMMLINFLVQKLQSTKTLILDLFCPQKY